MRLHRCLPALLLVAPLAAQQKIERRIAIAPDASIRIHNLVGSIRIIGWDRDSIAVTGSVPPGAGSFYMGGAGRGAKLGIERQDEVKQGQPATLEVRVPRNARLWVKSASATVEASGLTGELECSSVDGSIRVEGSLRLVIAESMEGNINVAGAMSVARLKGGGGTITLRGARGDVLATTVGGAIVATDGAITRAHLETVSGTIAYDGTVSPRGTLDVATHSGDVTLRLPPDISAEFDLGSFDGSILYGLSGKGEGKGKGEEALKPFRGKPISFSTGAGEARIIVRSFKGEIRILKP
jgi:putative adhesin